MSRSNGAVEPIRNGDRYDDRECGENENDLSDLHKLVKILPARKICGKMDSRRIFLAIDISDAARAACAAHVGLLRKEFAKVRVGWERTQKMHITLKFLGNTETDVLEILQSRITEVASQQPAFPLRLAGPGVFPSRSRPRILWIGITDPSDATASLYAQVEEVCRELGFEREKKAFHPHI